MEGSEVLVVEAVPTPWVAAIPTKGYDKDVHPNEVLGRGRQR